MGCSTKMVSSNTGAERPKCPTVPGNASLSLTESECAASRSPSRPIRVSWRPSRGSGSLGAMAPKKTTKFGFEIVGTVGDVNFPEYGGGEVYKQGERGALTLEYVEPPPDDVEFDDPEARWTIYRIALDKGVPEGSLKAVAKTAGQRPSDLKKAFESDDPMQRAWAYETWAGHYGWESFDEYPLILDKRSVEDRYDVDLESELPEEE